MKRGNLVLGITCILCLSSTSFAQHSDSQPASLGIDFTLNDYHSRIQWLSAKFHPIARNTPGVSIHYIKGIGGKYNWSVMTAGAFSDSIFRNKRLNEKQILIESNFNIERKFGKPAAAIHPFLSAGLGAAYYDKKISAFIPAGIGAQARINKYVYIRMNGQYRWLTGSDISSHFFYSIGISGVLTRKPSPDTKLSVELPVVVENEPIKDSDGDGIPDHQDRCPDKPGPASNSGCPADTTDLPKQKEDISTFQASAIQSDSLHNRLKLLAKRIHFETNSAVIQPQSYYSLDQVVKILRLHKYIQIDIHGHTDNVGSANANLLLSRARARAVADYFISKGIAASRLKHLGFGESIPIADNNTEEGKAMNRRVEFITPSQHTSSQ